MSRSDDNYFSYNPLNRASEKRKDIEWLKEKIVDEKSVYVLFSDLQPVVTPTEKDRKQYHLCKFLPDEIKVLRTNKDYDEVFLGVYTNQNEDMAWFAINIMSLDEAAVKVVKSNAELLSLMPGGMMMAHGDAGIVAQARSILAWHDRYFLQLHPRMITINLPGIHNTAYPRTDPTVIMAISDDAHSRLLLGRGKKFPPGMWSCLAGFLEPGETIEDACRRETKEESGIAIGRVVYHSSQPWPMPCSLMIGCIAYASTHEITVDKDELEEAKWFSKEEVQKMLARKHPSRLFVPPEQAIAHKLIKHWLSLSSNL